MKAKFRVQHSVISGLKYIQVAKRMGLSNKMQEMIVRRLSGQYPIFRHADMLNRARMDRAQLRSLSMKRNVSIEFMDCDQPFKPILTHFSRTRNRS